MPVYGKKVQFGDLLATVDVILPTNLSDTEVELFGQAG